MVDSFMGLKVKDLEIILYLCEHEDEMISISKIAQDLGFNWKTASGSVRKLVKFGFVRRMTRKDLHRKPIQVIGTVRLEAAAGELKKFIEIIKRS